MDGVHVDANERIRALEHALQQKDLALREVQHRAKNGLQLAISLLRLQVGRMRDPEARAAFEHTLHRIEALTLVYRQLHQSGSDADVDLGSYIGELAQLAASPADDLDIARSLVVRVKTEHVVADLTMAMTLGLVVNELILVAQRHAFTGPPLVTVQLERAGPTQVRLSVTNNGRPIPAGFDQAGDDALMLIEALAGQLGGTIQIDTVGGSDAHTRSVLEFPLIR